MKLYTPTKPCSVVTDMDPGCGRQMAGLQDMKLQGGIITAEGKLYYCDSGRFDSDWPMTGRGRLAHTEVIGFNFLKHTFTIKLPRL